MTMRLRARNLQRATGMPYQKCLGEITKLGEKPRELAERFNWPLKRADLYLFDPALDPAYKAASRGARYVSEHECENCYETFFVGTDKKGILVTASEQFCDGCIDGAGGKRECPGGCGRELLGLDYDEGPCRDCWDRLMSRD